MIYGILTISFLRGPSGDGVRQVAFATSVRAPIIRHSRKLALPVCLIKLFFRCGLRSNKCSVSEASTNLADTNCANSLTPSPGGLPPIHDSLPRIPLSVYIENLPVSATPDAGCFVRQPLFLLWYMVYIIGKFLSKTEEVANENI